jgi:NADPH-dependent 2,4-dienoyl-CoA reductase/sulfur reductase-like enzyme
VTERLVIVGGDAAGMTAAATARRRANAGELEVVAFERGEYTSYSACGLPYYVADTIGDAQELVARTPEEHRERGIDVRMRHEVVGIDLGARTVTAHDHDGADVVEPFDQLVVATGATPIRPDLPGIDGIGVHGIQTLTDGIDLRAHVREHLHADQHAVVVGSGYVGLEMAEALKLRGMPVTIIEAGAQPMSGVDPDMGVLVADAIRGEGIALHTETEVLGFETDDDGHVRRVITDDGVLPADLVVLGIGVRANSALAKEAGVAVGDSGGIATDARMATSVDGIWAAGDCAESYHRVSRKNVVIPLGTHANKQGRVVGINVTGGHATFGGVIGTAVTRICEVEIGRTGLSEKEARDAGFDYVTAKIESTTRAGYYPGASKITVKVLAERSSGRLLGAQIIGREGAAKRIDVMATAVWNEMPVDEIVQLDLAYAPPFSPIWDPVIIAAQQALKEL